MRFKLLLGRLMLLGFRAMLRLFPNICRASFLRTMRALWWFARRDHDLNAKILQQMVDDRDLNFKIWLKMGERVVVWLQKHEISRETFLALVPLPLAHAPQNPVIEMENTSQWFADSRLTHAERMEWIVFNLKFLQNLQIRICDRFVDFLALQSVEFYTLKDAGGNILFVLKPSENAFFTQRAF
ncbi:hypothetical protein NHP190012_04240 [Helicobacter sp. NHP19-012]|uniref:Uncharacterized protein n=1 Tax=Helicobacter gastrofelis TaxID=2849642 RepID=A0ABM7SDH1_9HELI|nr:hypothetical protein [Helicobacter sp. NHP19-012]BCZ18782.1 hypothetical protein NHP190012_04240 [Helicobacter sp. NHP19-012]